MGVDAEDRMAAVSRESLLAMANLGTHTPFLASDFSPAFSSFFRTHLRFQLLNFSTVVPEIEPFLNCRAKKKIHFPESSTSTVSWASADCRQKRFGAKILTRRVAEPRELVCLTQWS